MLSIKVILCLQNTQIRRDGQQIEKYINSTNEKVPTPNTNNIIATTIPTVNTTKAGSPEVLTPTSYITFTDMAKRKEHVDADLLCSVDRHGHLGSLCWNIMHMVITHRGLTVT